MQIHIGWTVFSSGIFACSGLINVLLFVFTGRRYGLAPTSDARIQHNRREAIISYSGNNVRYVDWRTVKMDEAPKEEYSAASTKASLAGT
jgi:hypothetical protein